MAEARIRHDWDQTASLLALIAETHRDPDKRSRPFEPREFHPLYRRKKRGLTREDMKLALESFAGAKFDEPKPGLWEQITGGAKPDHQPDADGGPKIAR